MHYDEESEEGYGTVRRNAGSHRHFPVILITRYPVSACRKIPAGCFSEFRHMDIPNLHDSPCYRIKDTPLALPEKFSRKPLSILGNHGIV